MDWFSFGWIESFKPSTSIDTTFSLSASRPAPLLKGRLSHGQLYLRRFVCMQHLPILGILFFHVLFAPTAACTAQQTRSLCQSFYEFAFLALSSSALYCFNFLPPLLGFVNHLCNNNQPWILTLRGAANEYRRLLFTMVTGKRQ